MFKIDLAHSLALWYLTDSSFQKRQIKGFLPHLPLIFIHS